MATIYLFFLGLIVFTGAVWVLGVWLRKHPSKENAEKSSRILHFLFFAGLVAPPLIGLFFPGLSHFDEMVGLKPLPWKNLFLVIGVILAVPGFYFMGITNKLLRKLGSGTNAFRLTKQIVNEDIYKRTRNPMSLGFYLLALTAGLVPGSTFITLGALLGIIPAHIFFLKYFEELELELRFGSAYLEYKRNVPFLIPKIASSGAGS